MKLQVKKYGKNYNLLINGQDFEIYVPRLKTIQELQDEPVDECPRRNNRRIEFRTFSRSEVRNTEGEAMIFSSSSPMISNFASNVKVFLGEMCNCYDFRRKNYLKMKMMKSKLIWK